MTGNGITGATTNITDDVDAILRARQAACHELRVLHHIRLRGRSVLNSLNAIAVASDGNGSGLRATNSPNGGNQQIPGNAFQGRRPSAGSGGGGGLSGSGSSQSYSDYRDASSFPSREFNARYADTNSSTPSNPECTGFWCVLRDLALAYAIIAASFLLYKYFTSSRTDSPSTTGEAYDNIP